MISFDLINPSPVQEVFMQVLGGGGGDGDDIITELA